MQLSVPFVLASSSPRRQALLSKVGFSFTSVSPDLDEVQIENESAHDMVARLAVEKASLVAKDHPSSLVLGSDTCVELHGSVLGKPESAAEARHMLSQLSGQTHSVYTGIALVHLSSSRVVSHVEQTSVTFASLSAKEIEDYVNTGSPMDKAGAYGIQDDQGAFFVKSIAGDFYTVMGLPLHQLYVLLRSRFPDLIRE